MQLNIILSNLVRFLHILLILFIVLAPFSNIPIVLVLHIALGLCLIIHWYTNNNMCSLTIIESKLRGVKYSDTFMDSLVSPVYSLSKNNGVFLIYTTLFILMSVSGYRLYMYLKDTPVFNTTSLAKPRKN